MKAIANRIDRALDDALGMTFPASDPIAVFVPAALARPPDHEIGADLAGCCSTTDLVDVPPGHGAVDSSESVTGSEPT
jgi:hypothetical protein